MPATSDPPVCPWCSAELRTADDARCPSCGAVLRDEKADAEVPGVTRVDHEAILRSRAPAQKSRGLIGWLSGEYQVAAAPEPPESLAPPDAEVRREMLRMELAALSARAEAELAEARLAEAQLIEPEVGGDRGDDGPPADDGAARPTDQSAATEPNRERSADS